MAKFGLPPKPESSNQNDTGDSNSWMGDAASAAGELESEDTGNEGMVALEGELPKHNTGIITDFYLGELLRPTPQLCLTLRRLTTKELYASPWPS
jgi:hypothetical protein